MWRPLFMATGFALCIVGAECMVVDRFVLAESITKPLPQITTEDYTSWEADLPLTSGRKVLVPPEWAPWGLFSGGIMLVMYTASFGSNGGRRRFSDDDE